MDDRRRLGFERALKQSGALELRATGRGSVALAVALTLRMWLSHRLFGSYDDRSFLFKSNHAVLAALRKNESDVRLYMLAIFISIECDRLDNANEMLDAAMGYRAYLRSGEPIYYAILCFLYAYLEIKQKRVRSARKHLRSLYDLIGTGGGGPEYSLMLGMLHLSFREYKDAYEYLRESYTGGCRSVFLFNALYEYYRTDLREYSANDEKILFSVLSWAAAKEAEIDGITDVLQDVSPLGSVTPKNFETASHIFHISENAYMLREICVFLMDSGSLGSGAYYFYREAERRQLFLDGLCAFLIKSAYVNGVERISHYAMKEYLKDPDPDVSMSVYVYHLLITDQAHSDLIPERRNDMLKLCAYCIENEIPGREANSLYKYFRSECDEMEIAGQLYEKAEELLYRDLTKFDVYLKEGSPTRYIYVNEREKKGVSVYEVPEGVRESDGPAAIIEAVNGGFDYKCMSSGRKNILAETLAIKRRVSGADFGLYLHFYRRGARSFEIVAYLANGFLDHIDSGSEDFEYGSDTANEAISVFEALLDSKEAAKPYRMRVLVALGGLCYRAGRFDSALGFFGGVDENELDDSHIEQILNVFLRTNEFPRAAGLIVRKRRFIPNASLFAAVKKLSGQEFESLHEHIAEAAYGLLTDAWYDPDLLAITLKFYNGGQSEWEALSHSLSAVNVTSPGLDEIIVRNSIWMHQFDEDAQKAFVRLATTIGGERSNHPLVRQFVEFCTYEMLINDLRPEYDTLNLLEKIYLADRTEGTREPGDECESSDTELLAYALCHVYFLNGLTTFNSERISKEAAELQEEREILFPIFREYRGKNEKIPYIEKNQPFMYRSLPGKNVWLYYRVDDETKFHAKKMRYLRFGLYLAHTPLFYGETLTYYFSEEISSGSITTREKTVSNDVLFIRETGTDLFFEINNAVIYGQMFRNEQVETIIGGLVKDTRNVRSGII